MPNNPIPVSPIYVNLFKGSPKEGDARLKLHLWASGELHITRQLYTDKWDWVYENDLKAGVLKQDELQYLPALIEALCKIEGTVTVTNKTKTSERDGWKYLDTPTPGTQIPDGAKNKENG